MSEDKTSPVKISLGENKSLEIKKKEKRKTLKSFLCTTTALHLRIITAPTLRDNGGGGREGAGQGTAVLEPALQRQGLTGQIPLELGCELEGWRWALMWAAPNYVLGT